MAAPDLDNAVPPVKVEEQNENGSGRSQRRGPADAAPVIAGQGAVPSASAGAVGLVQGLQQAHTDFCRWFYESHGVIYDSQIGLQMDNRGLKREWLGYGAVAFLLILLSTKMAPLAATIICIGYPLMASLAVLRGQVPGDQMRVLVYWAIFGLFSLGDYRFGHRTLYWVLKVVACVFLYLPQTQGAAIVYTSILEPAVNFLDANIYQRLQ